MKKLITFILIITLTSPLFGRAGGHYSSSRGGHSYSSMGSKGDQTYRPSSQGGQPISKSSTQPRQQNGSPTATPQASRGSFFQQHPILTGLASGFIGSWIFSQFFGDHHANHDANSSSETGEESSTDWLGTLMDIAAFALIIGGAMILWRRWKEKQQQDTSPSSFTYDEPMTPPKENPFKAVYGNTTSSSFPSEEGVSDQEVTKLFLEVQSKWSQGDIGGLRFCATPEMVGYFSDALTNNTSQGVINTLTDVQVLALTSLESWREGTLSYHTVKIAFSMVDQTFNREGVCVSGEMTPIKGEEMWTFVSSQGGSWLLSAIEQA